MAGTRNKNNNQGGQSAGGKAQKTKTDNRFNPSAMASKLAPVTRRQLATAIGATKAATSNAPTRERTNSNNSMKLPLQGPNPKLRSNKDVATMAVRQVRHYHLRITA